MEIARYLADVRARVEKSGPLDQKMSADRLKDGSGGHSILTSIKNLCKKTGLRISVRCVERILWNGDNEITVREAIEELNHLHRTIMWEMDEEVFFHLPAKKAEYFGKPMLFGEEVAKAFPSIAYNLEEAGNCLALNRNTACVFHLQGVMQAGLNALGKALEVPETTNRTWDAILKKIDPELSQTFMERSPYFQQHEQFCAEAAALLRAVKIAWRNPVMHVEKVYDEEKATDVMNAVKGFMRHLATELKEMVGLLSEMK